MYKVHNNQAKSLFAALSYFYTFLRCVVSLFVVCQVLVHPA